MTPNSQVHRRDWTRGAKAGYYALSVLAWVALLIPVVVVVAYGFSADKWAGLITVSVFCLAFAWCAATGNLVQRRPWK